MTKSYDDDYDWVRSEMREPVVDHTPYSEEIRFVGFIPLRENSFPRQQMRDVRRGHNEHVLRAVGCLEGG